MRAFEGPDSKYRVSFDGDFRLDKARTRPPAKAPDKATANEKLTEAISELRGLQDRLYASDRVSLLVMFQAMDAAGKDGTIRSVLTGVNPAGCQVFSFKQPSADELDHDFLWRCTRCLPERGRIGIFNRSWYEEVLVVRVHPELLAYQRLPWPAEGEELWEERLRSIADFERHLARNGTAIVKFFLNVSKEEQRERFLSRIDEPEKNWKFAIGDVKERQHWDAYMAAYEAAMNATSKPWAPWYAIPADNKSYMRLQVAKILVKSLASLDLQYPEVDSATRDRFASLRAALEAEDGGTDGA